MQWARDEPTPLQHAPEADHRQRQWPDTWRPERASDHTRTTQLTRIHTKEAHAYAVRRYDRYQSAHSHEQTVASRPASRQSTVSASGPTALTPRTMSESTGGAACGVLPEPLASPVCFSSPLPAFVWQTTFDVGALTGRQLLQLAVAVFQDADCLASDGSAHPEECSGEDAFDVPLESLGHFLSCVQRHHHVENPSHGWPHGVHVMFNFYRFLRPALQHFTRFERLTLLISCVCHDLQHCGMGNGWCAAASYWCNSDHQSKSYTDNLLERNSVERTIELLTGQPISAPLEVATTTTPNAADPSSAPRDYLSEWGVSPRMRDRLISQLTELILGTDITDRTRHRELTSEFAALVARTQPSSADVARACCGGDTEKACEEETVGEPKSLGGSDQSTARTTRSASAPAPLNVGAVSGFTGNKRRPSADASQDRKKAKKTTAAGSDDAAEAGDNDGDSSSTTDAPFSFTFTSASHRFSLTRVLILCADIGCVGELFPIVISWIDRLYEESTLGHNFIVASQAAKEAQAETTSETSETGAAAVAPASPRAAALPRPRCMSRYRLENDDSLSPAAAAAAEALAPAVDESTRIATVPCVSLTSYYRSQLQFYSVYAVSLFRPLHESGLLPLLSQRFFPQLQRNVRYLATTTAVKPYASKMRIHARPCDSQEETDLMRQLREEYDAVARFHTSLNRQQAAEDRPRVISLVFDATPLDDPPTMTEPLQAHATHQHRADLACRTVNTPL